MTAPGWVPDPRLHEPLPARLARARGSDDATLQAVRDEHVRRYDPVLRAFVEWRPVPGDSRDPLTFAVKDLVDVGGFSTRAGSAWFRRYPVRSAPVVTHLERVAAVAGKVVTSEFGVGTRVETVNPWYPDFSCGGSSSGSAAAVAAGFCDFALGTETVASVRHPASCCGIVGLRLTPRKALVSGVLSLAPSLDSVGLITRSASDLATIWALPGMRALRAAAGADRDPSPVEQLRLGWVTNWQDEDVPADVASMWAAVTVAIASAGIALEPTTLSWWRERERTWPLVAREFHDVHARRLPDHERHSSDAVRRVVDLGASVGDEEYRALLADRRRVEAAAARTFERVDVLVLPLDPYLPRRLDTPRPDSVVPAGASAQGETSVGFLELAALPRLPALSLPAGHARDGAPLAVQLLARRGGEPALVAAATRLEAVLGVANPAVAAAGA